MNTQGLRVFDHRITDKKKAHKIDQVIELVRERLATHLIESTTRFAQRYFARVPPDDLMDYPAEDLYGAVLCHSHLARRRKPGTSIVRVYNPVLEEHGWQSRHTVAEIVTDDMPFLVDSANMALIRHGLTVHQIIHPVMHVRRNRKDELVDLVLKEVVGADVLDEAWIHFEVDQQTDPERLKALRADLLVTLGDVRAVVEDWSPMRERMKEAIAEIEARSKPLPLKPEEIAEDLEFLRWVANHHFTFIGFRKFDLVEERGEHVLRLIANSGLGLFRDSEPGHAHPIPARLRELARSPTLLILTKSALRSTVHRPVHLDYLGIKRFDDAGRVIGEWRFQGLYSSVAYDTRPDRIPLLRRKVAKAIERAALSPVGHTGKALRHILDTLPRDEMIQATDGELLDIALGILNIQERRRLRVFIRRDMYGRFISALVFVPRERYSTQLRVHMQAILMEAFEGQGSEFNVQFTESVLARVHFVIRTDPSRMPDFDVRDIEARMVDAMLSWQDKLRLGLLDKLGEAEGNRLFARYTDAFPAAYRDDYTPRTAVLDIQRLETIHDNKSMAMHLYRPPEDEEQLRFKVFGRHRAMALSDVLPILERQGLTVLGARPYEIEPRGEVSFWILNFDVRPAHGIDVEVPEVKERFQEAFAKISRGDMENDGFNALVLLVGLNWREITMLRALCKYLLQTRVPFSQTYMEQTLIRNAQITRRLVDLFHARFDPRRQDKGGARHQQLVAQIQDAVDGVASLDEDRILRYFLGLMLATVRTNYFQRDEPGGPKAYLSFKLDSAQVPELPLPLPKFEIFVYATDVEGIHLRGGLVARGGIRWSDRREDFRTEILGLMKAQMVKNAVIVPVGAKGGFVPKQLPAGGTRDEIQGEVIRCYRIFIRGLLDLTDNRLGNEIRPPAEVVRHDPDDPYLVVAADKGTAAFSDIANELAEQYGFWLGDAFASGGTHGYDHKKMGITARGAWESVKRHFRELDIDAQTTPFTVVGIGDMSGDVFGNGMLRSPHTRLIAAFNHVHIFIDPHPDPATSFKERERLFKLPRSAWTDYGQKLISKGGAIYPRSAKSITLSPQARQALDIEAERLRPNALIQAIVRAPVDLLWNGGIGTYIKATDETHAEAGDRANDNVRIDAAELRCRIVAEGGNLGFTQRARVEFARKGGLVYTDAIDNSGGVDCSDHEVNIKILLNKLVAEGDMTAKQRNQLLANMTDEVADMVLRDNYLQTQAISVTANQADYFLADHIRLITVLEKEGRLKRKLEALPNDEELAEREAAHTGLTRPEIAVLLAYSKIRLYEHLLESDISNDEHLCGELHAYFPETLRERFANQLNAHSLRAEITATHITNNMVNRMGSTFVVRMQEETGTSAADIARAYTAAREIFEIDALWDAIEGLDNKVSAQTQIEMFGETRRLMDRSTRWLLRHRHPPIDIQIAVDSFTETIHALAGRLAGLVRGEMHEKLEARIQKLSEAAVPADLARRIANLDPLFFALDIADVARETDTPIVQAAETHFELGVALDLHWLNERMRELPRRNHWNRSVRGLLRDELNNAHSTLTTQLLRTTTEIKSTDKRIEAWLDNHQTHMARYKNMIAELKSITRVDMAMLSVAMRELRNLAEL